MAICPYCRTETEPDRAYHEPGDCDPRAMGAAMDWYRERHGLDQVRIRKLTLRLATLKPAAPAGADHPIANHSE